MPKKTKPTETTEQEQKKSIHEQRPWLFKPGESGNPSGRPPGSKNKPKPVEELATLIAEHKIKIDSKRKRRYGLNVDEMTVLENILLDWATSLSPVKQQQFMDRFAGKVANINVNTNQNIDFVSRYRAKFTDSELEEIANGADALEILISKIPDEEE